MRLTWLALPLLGGCGSAAPPPAEEARPARVIDHAGALSANEETALAATSAELERRTTDRLVVITLPSLGGPALDAAALTLEEFGAREDGTHNGVLLIVAPNEQQARILGSRGLQPVLTAQRARAIVGTEMLPRLRAGQVYAGISAASAAIARLLVSQPERARWGHS